MDFKLKTIDSFISNDDIIYPFDLQSCGDLLIHRTKVSCEVLTFYDYQNITPTKIQLSAIQTKKPTLYPQLNINKPKILDNCDQNEKNYIMTNPYMFPDCTFKNIHYLKCEMSRTGYILACLTSSGMIELYNYDTDGSELKNIDVNLSELRKNSLKKSSKDITKFEILCSSLNEISFNNFEWCPISFDDHNILICTTKSDDIVFYHVQDDTVIEVKAIKIEGASKNKMKWINMNDKHYLLIGTEKGHLNRYSIELGNDGTINDLRKFDVIEGKLKMPINYIAIDSYGASTIILCCKGHTLEIFHIKGDKTDLVCSKYIDMTITGIKIYNNLEYLLCTLNSGIYYIQLHDDVMSLSVCKKLEFTLSDEQDGVKINHAYYGIATSKNNVLLYLSCFPQNAFDHLVNKQPNHISINLFTKYDPLQIIMNNDTFRLTDYTDCVEAIRYIGLGKFEMLGALEQMDYNISISLEFLYYLKIQLLVIETKLIYYQMKSRNIFKIIEETKESIKELILVINAQMLLMDILEIVNLTEMHYKVMQSLRKLIFAYCNANLDKEPFKTALETLKPELVKSLEICDAKLNATSTSPEICSFCQESISNDALECSSGHKLKRCITTNMLVSLDSNNFCRRCKESVASLEILSLIADNQSEVNILLCPLCDLKVVLNE